MNGKATYLCPGCGKSKRLDSTLENKNMAIYTAQEVNQNTKCWMVRRWEAPIRFVQLETGLIMDLSGHWRKIRNTDYHESEIYGASTKDEAIQIARNRDGL
jgi:hypothetical protein